MLEICHFVPTKQLNLKILYWKQMEFVQSNTSLFNGKTLLKSYRTLFIRCRTLLKSNGRLFIRCRTNIRWISLVHRWIYDGMLKGYIHCWNQMVKSKLKKGLYAREIFQVWILRFFISNFRHISSYRDSSVLPEVFRTSWIPTLY